MQLWEDNSDIVPLTHFTSGALLFPAATCSANLPVTLQQQGGETHTAGSRDVTLQGIPAGSHICGVHVWLVNFYKFLIHQSFASVFACVSERCSLPGSTDLRKSQSIKRSPPNQNSYHDSELQVGQS